MSSVAVFFADYEDVQIPGSIGTDTNGDGINDTFTGVTTNAGAAELPGFEYEGTFRANDNWSFRWALGWLDAEYTEFVSATGEDVSDQAVFQNTPEWTASAALTFETPLAQRQPVRHSVIRLSRRRQPVRIPECTAGPGSVHGVGPERGLGR